MSELQILWFFLIGILLAGYAVLDGFDLGVGFWQLFRRKESHRRAAIHAIGPVWDGNEVWLLTGGGALFAAFPPVYASVFSGFYLPLMLVLTGLIFRAVAIEFRGKVDSGLWRGSWDLAFGVGSILPALLFGVALGNVVRGLPLNETGDYIGGFFALLNPYALLVGISGLAMFATHGALYLAVKTTGELREQARYHAYAASRVYFILFLAAAGWSLWSFVRGSMLLAGVATGIAFLAIVAIGVFLKRGAVGRAFVASAVSILALFGATGAAIFPNLVPASNDAALSLTIHNASSSQYTLTAMAILAAVGVPLVLGYTIWIYRVFAGPVEVEDTGDAY